MNAPLVRHGWTIAFQPQLFVKGRADGADSVTLTINEVNTGRNAPHRFRLALVSVEDDRAMPPVYVSGVDWGLPGFGTRRSPRICNSYWL